MSFIGRATAVLLVSGGCISELSTRPSIGYGSSGRSFHIVQDVFAATSGAPTEAPPAPVGDKLTLAEAYRLALRVNETVAIAELGVRAAEIASQERNTQLYPDVHILATAGTQSDRLLGPAPNRFVVASLEVTQPVFRKGYLSSRAAGRYKIDSADALVARERERLARDVVAVFVNDIRARTLHELALAAVTRTTATVQHLAALKKAGAALRSAELLSQLDLKRAERQAVAAERDVGLADAAFHRLIGVPPPAELELLELPTLPDAVASLALARKRKDIQALEIAVQQAHSELEVATGQRWWPRFDVLANLQTGKSVFSAGISQPNNYAWSISGVLTIPIFQQGKETVTIQRAENETRITERNLELQTKIVSEEVQYAAIQIDATQKVADLAERQLAAAQENYKLVNTQFGLGAITFLEVTHAQELLVEAENTTEAAKMDRVIAVYDYLFAIGALDLSTAK